MTATPNAERLEILRTMVASREFDRRAGIAYRQGLTWFHISSAGHEALAALARHLRPDDVIAPHYRDRALLLARGMSLADMARDLLAKPLSGSGGRNMTSHFSSRRHGVFSVASPVASNCLPAAGFAWAAQLRRTDDAVLCLIGDASARQGEFYEALCFAIERSLPLVFVVEDNHYGISMPTQATTPLSLDMLPADRLVRVDGSDPDAVDRAGDALLAAVRLGAGPAVLWCDLDRIDSHTSSDDHRVYRPASELAAMRDPLRVLRDRLIAEGVLSATEYEELSSSARAQVGAIFADVLSEDQPSIETVTEHLHAVGTLPPAVPTKAAPMTMRESVNRALAEALEDPRTLIFGQDVEDPKGGVFGLTRGLGATGRVVNSPLAEATIVGVCVGLAAAGLRPIAELQFIDFAAPAWNQITSQLATLRWRTAGEWQCPVVLYAPSGAYLPGGGIWHSQSNESLFAHVPGIRVAAPSALTDVGSVFVQARATDDPVMIMLPKRELGRTPHLPTAPSPRVVRAGSEVTVVAWGNATRLALAAADLCAEDGVDVEVVDLCWLQPCSLAAVRASLARTNRLVVVQETVAPASLGASIIAEIVGDPLYFELLAAPPTLISRKYVHVPYNPHLEDSVLPNPSDVAVAVRAVLAPIRPERSVRL